MATSVVMPALEMAQETGRLLAWRKREGEAVRKGEPLMEVETDKAVVEVEAEADGILAGVRAQEGDVVAVGRTIAWIVAPGEAVPTADTGAPAAAAQAPGAAESGPAAAPSAPAERETPSERVLASPKARRLAAERGIDLHAVASGSGRRPVSAADVVAAAPQTAASVRVETPERVWRLMAERVTATWTTVPQFFVARDVDATALVAWRARFPETSAGNEETSVTYSDLLIAVVARALRRHPRLNASWRDGDIVYHPRINIGLATATDDGLVVPVIHDADRRSAIEIARTRRDLVERARTNRLRPADLERPMGEAGPDIRLRVHLARALAFSPDLLILFYPTERLDRAAAFELGRLVRRVCRGLTLLLFTRDEPLAAWLCRRLVFIDPATGAVREVRPRFPWRERLRRWLRA